MRTRARLTLFLITSDPWAFTINLNLSTFSNSWLSNRTTWCLSPGMGADITLVFEALLRTPTAPFRSKPMAYRVMIKGHARDAADRSSCLTLFGSGHLTQSPLPWPVSSRLAAKTLLISMMRFGLLKLKKWPEHMFTWIALIYHINIPE